MNTDFYNIEIKSSEFVPEGSVVFIGQDCAVGTKPSAVLVNSKLGKVLKTNSDGSLLIDMGQVCRWSRAYMRKYIQRCKNLKHYSKEKVQEKIIKYAANNLEALEVLEENGVL